LVAPSEIADLARRLEYSGLLKREWNSDLHPRWPGGSADGAGGQFAPAGPGVSEPRRPRI
jgi:hypothetical protein